MIERFISSMRIERQNINELDNLIEFLQNIKADMLQDEDTEFAVTCEPLAALFKFGLMRLTKTDHIEPDGRYGLEPIGDFLTFLGVIDGIDSETGGWIRLKPVR
jgi:hypothetical protein